VIGYGNVLRRDDGVGPVVIDRLRARLGARPGIDLIAAHQLLPEMCDDLVAARLVVFIDACVDQPPGSLRWRRLAASDDPTGASIGLGHHQQPQRLLTMTRLIHGRRPRAIVAGIGVGSLEFGEGLTPAAAAAVDRVVDRLARRLAADPVPREGRDA
jgi:hydrogenase maturation protease